MVSLMFDDHQSSNNNNTDAFWLMMSILKMWPSHLSLALQLRLHRKVVAPNQYDNIWISQVSYIYIHTSM